MTGVQTCALPIFSSATEQGDLAKGMQFIGQSQGLIHDVCSAEEMMQRLVKVLDKRLLAIQEKI